MRHCLERAAAALALILMLAAPASAADVRLAQSTGGTPLGGVTIEGRIAPGAKLKVHVKANPGRAFPVKVVQFQPAEMMRWSGGMPLGLFKGERTYRLTPHGDGTTTFTMREEYTGPLLPLIWRSIPDLGPSFQQFANGLKKQVEAPA